MLELGFTEFVEVGLGGDLTAKYEAEEWREAHEKGEKKVTSCCPGFVNMVRRHFPELSGAISTTVSPMCAVSRLIKAKDPEAVTVFIGPCLAKKSEVVDQKIEGNADYVLTYSEVRAMMRAKDVALEPVEDTYQEASVFGKRFGNSGGVAAAVQESLKESGNDIDIKVCKANGAAECKKALLLMKVGACRKTLSKVWHATEDVLEARVLSRIRCLQRNQGIPLLRKQMTGAFTLT